MSEILTREEYCGLTTEAAIQDVSTEVGARRSEEIELRLDAHDAALRASLEIETRRANGAELLVDAREARVAALEKALREAPHDEECPANPPDFCYCDCWKAAALEGKPLDKTL